MYEKLEVCPLCKHTSFTNHLICKDHSISGESFALSKCNKCELIFTNPRPDESSIHKYYEAEDYISHANKSNNLINLIYKIVRNYTIKKKVKLVKKHSNGNRILDFGCGTGEFLEGCNKKGFEVFGYEPSALARNQSIEKGIQVVEDLKEIKGKLDIITAWHVIEHVTELRKTIKALKRKLDKDGVLIIAVPNITSYDSQYYGEFWAGLDVPRHLYHFDRESFGKLIDKCKLHLIDTIPMIFDSFYVSMLSEKYKSQKNHFIRALKVGYQSNKKAKASGDYSSLIYILRK